MFIKNVFISKRGGDRSYRHKLKKSILKNPQWKLFSALGGDILLNGVNLHTAHNKKYPF